MPSKFFQKGFPWAGYKDNIFFQKHGCTFFRNKWLWQTLATALWTWHYCHFHCHRTRLFPCRSPKGQKAHLSGTELLGFQHAPWTTLVAIIFCVMTVAWCSGRTWESHRLRRIPRYCRQMYSVLLQNSNAPKSLSENEAAQNYVWQVCRLISDFICFWKKVLKNMILTG